MIGSSNEVHRRQDPFNTVALYTFSSSGNKRSSATSQDMFHTLWWSDIESKKYASETCYILGPLIPPCWHLLCLLCLCLNEGCQLDSVKHLNGGKLLCSALSIKVTTKANSQDMFHRLHTVLVRHWDQVNYASDNRSWDPIILTKQALNTLLLQGGISLPADMCTTCFVCAFCLFVVLSALNRILLKDGRKNKCITNMGVLHMQWWQFL